MNRFTVIALMSAIIACVAVVITTENGDATDDSSSSYDTSFSIDYLTYYVTEEPVSSKGYGTVKLSSYNEDENPDPEGTLTIPDYVINPDTSKKYLVTSIELMTIYNIKIGEIVIGDNVVNIGDANFYNCVNLTKVTLGKSISVVGDGFLGSCSKLETVVIMGTQFTLSDGSKDPNDTGNLYLNENIFITHIGPTGETVKLRDSTTTLNGMCFEGDTDLKYLELPNGVQVIEEQAFRGCTSLFKITSGGTENTLPESLLILGNEAFYGCTSFVIADLPVNLRLIGSCAFYGCNSLIKVTIGYSIAYIGSGAFAGCASLSAIEVDGISTTAYSSLDGVLYRKEVKNDYASLVQYPQGKTLTDGTFTLPSKTISIESYAFRMGELGTTSSLTHIVLPSSLQEIKSGAFEYCTGLKEITIPGSVEEIEMSVFANCSDLETLTLESGVKVISSYAFEKCTSLKTVNFPDTLTELDLLCFAGCSSLTSVVLPESLRVMEGAFMGCYNLENITINSSKVTFEMGAFSIGYENHPADVTITKVKGCEIKETLFNEYTTYTIVTIGEEPYPYENWVVIVICALIMIATLRYIRRV